MFRENNAFIVNKNGSKFFIKEHRGLRKYQELVMDILFLDAEVEMLHASTDRAQRLIWKN